MENLEEPAPIRRIVLTGFMGSGKSTVGPLLARRLGWRFLDADEVIVAETGISIAEFFARHGEAAFRDREHATIARLAEEDALVLAPVAADWLPSTHGSIAITGVAIGAQTIGDHNSRTHGSGKNENENYFP